MRFCLPLWVATRVLRSSSSLARVVTLAGGNVNAAKKIEAAVSDQILLFMLRASFARFDRCSLLHEFTEVESGKNGARPELVKATAACKKHKARLVIAKLDRLSRNVAFIATLLEKKVDFVAVDNLAAVAEFERDAISKRTTKALAAAKARGVKLGNYHRIALGPRRRPPPRVRRAYARRSNRLPPCPRPPQPPSSTGVALRRRVVRPGMSLR
jgi:hypothetical protein